MYVCRPLYLHHIWKYVNSETKYIEKIGDLKKKNEQGDTVIYSSAKTLKQKHYVNSSVALSIMKHDDFEPLKDRSCSRESMPVLVSEDDVLEKTEHAKC